MLADLTPEQRARLARGWVWRDGQLPIRCKARVYAVADDGSICVGDRKSEAWFKPGELTPDLDDDATADGLPRTARAMWRDGSLHVTPSLSGGFCLCRVGVGGLGQAEKQVWYGSEFRSPPATSLVRACSFECEFAAWLAAILAAPEAA